MARVTTVASARKDQGTCELCEKPILAGSPYQWTKSRFGPKRVRHDSCRTWRPSELTGSAALSIAYAAQEAAEDALGEWDREDADAARSILENLAEGLREAAEEWRTSASNIEDGFGHATYQSDELNEKADALDSAADEVETEADNIEDFDEDAVRAEVVDEVGEKAEDEVLQGIAEKRDEWADEVEAIVNDAIGGVEFP